MLTTIRPSRLAFTAAVMLAGLGGASSAVSAHAAHTPAEHPSNREHLVVRGQDTVAEPICQPSMCRFELTGGTFHGAPVGSGAYTGSFTVHLADSFSNGEGGTCAPIDGELTFAASDTDRLVIAIRGDSCQDGAGDPRTSSFTTLTHFKVSRGTGRYTHAHGHGVASFLEDASDHEQLTLLGSIAN